MQGKIDEIKAAITFQKTKVMCLNVAVGNVEMEHKRVVANTQLAANFLASLLKMSSGRTLERSSSGPPWGQLSGPSSAPYAEAELISF
mmetsp:Transcript_15570/g.43026  ORF Transcript_15570/g.43026 Transcript_15570/m.43026 type:complete len:88 (+) Transcript_15570:112-375(+)